jgi:hypothetical protein
MQNAERDNMHARGFRAIQFLSGALFSVFIVAATLRTGGGRETQMTTMFLRGMYAAFGIIYTIASMYYWFYWIRESKHLKRAANSLDSPNGPAATP